jgi:hypothetical protein
MLLIAESFKTVLPKRLGQHYPANDLEEVSKLINAPPVFGRDSLMGKLCTYRLVYWFLIVLRYVIVGIMKVSRTQGVEFHVISS